MALPATTAEPSKRADSEGAVEVAVRYVASTDGLMAHSPVGRREVLRGLVAPELLDAHVTATGRAIDEVDTRLGASAAELVWVEAPIATYLAAADAQGRATVDVWTVSVFAYPDAGLPEQIWRTVHVTVDERDGRWWAIEVTADAGPTPDANPLALPSDVDDFVRVAGWEPVVAGATR